ncbi:MAG: right-handed parallel beta-helix repeat-containing protein, partial [Candidatus Desantisbacteria bacterium]
MSTLNKELSKKVGLIMWFVVFAAIGVGVVSSNNAEANTLGEAVDNTQFVWTTGGNANWFAQTSAYYYDGDAARSGAIGDSQQTYIQATVTGAGALTFYWKVSSESGYDYLRFYIDGNNKGTISGTVDWTKMSYFIPSGTHTLKWAYTKDGSGISGSDCGWLDKVEFIPTTPAITILSGNYQQAIITTPLAPFVVKLTDIYANPIGSCSVTWQIIEPGYGAVLSATSTTTNVNGTTSTILTLGTKTGAYTVIATGSGLIATFTATATAIPVTVYNPDGSVANYTTIQAGVDACSVGGTVSVAVGTYTEEIYINKRIALVGVGSPTIDPPANGNAVTFDGTSTNGAIVFGFKITGATGSWPNGNGIHCNNGADPSITNNTISGNSNHGIYCDYSSPTITNNTITGNNYRGIYCSSSSSPTITNNTISGNRYDGIYCSSSPTITNNTISGNTYHGIRCDYSSFPIITNNTISGNSSNGIDCYYSSPTITNNTISGNSDNGIYCYSSSCPTITNNIITENGTTSSSYYGIYNSSGPIINYNDVWGNGSGGNNNYCGCSAGLYDISFNPQFIGGGDYHLQGISSCIDAGSNTARGISGTSTD